MTGTDGFVGNGFGATTGALVVDGVVTADVHVEVTAHDSGGVETVSVETSTSLSKSSSPVVSVPVVDKTVPVVSKKSPVTLSTTPVVSVVSPDKLKSVPKLVFEKDLRSVKRLFAEFGLIQL